MNGKNKNEVIIIGGNHHNLLGIARGLGKKGVKSNAIITNDNRYPYVKKSKYIKKSFIVPEDEKRVLEKLLLFKSTIKPVVFPCSDFAAYVIDKNYEKLKEFFILPSIRNTELEISKYMDKHLQSIIANQNGVETLKTLEFNTNARNIEIDINYPVIIKPKLSIYGSKNDMYICQNLNEIKSAFNELSKKSIIEVIIQEYLEYDYEISLIGLSIDNTIQIPCGVKKINSYPYGKGAMCFGKVICNKNLREIINLDCIKNMMSSIEYSGLFDIDLFIKNNKVYLNEINFRNSANSYSLMKYEISLPYIYYIEKTQGNNINSEEYILNDFFVVEDFNEKRLLHEKKITKKQYRDNYGKNPFSLVFTKDDKFLILWKYLYAVLKRVDKRQV